MNENTWNSSGLADLQETLNECFTEIGKYGTDTTQAAETENLKSVESKGVTVIDLDDATIAQMKEKAAPVYDMVREAVGNDLVDEYLAAIEAAK